MVRAMVCEQGPHASSPPARRKSLRRLASTRGFKPRTANEYGWIRVFEGLEPFALDAPSKLVKVTLNTTVEDVNKELGFGEELTLWSQIGGEQSRRLELDEYPLRIQEQFLATYGWNSAARRLRLAVDPELRHSLRWCAGPASPYGGVLRSGIIHILKGHVFPQWKPRPTYITGSQLHMYGSAWEIIELSGGSIELCQPKAQKLVLCLKPRCQGNGVPGDNSMNHLFLGFSTVWERNLWFSWLKEGTQSTQPPNVLDLSGGGRASLGSALAQHATGAFTVRVLRLRSNALATLPPQAWTLHALTHLDISDNRITELPEEICQLRQLEELQVSDNELQTVECALRLPRLRNLFAARNLITNFGRNAKHMGLDDDKEPRSPLTSVDLRNNKLKGSIILGNYEHLVCLDVSHNSIEVLVVSALHGLRELYAAHNTLQHLAIHGGSLRTLRAPHNRLETLTTTVPPINLVEIDLSNNNLTSLPQWLSGCSDLTTLHANNNQLTSLPDHLFCSELSSLRSLHLAHNKIANIPSMPRLRAPLKDLLLHDNSIQSLPENFFSVCDRLCVLNLSNNRLSRLPPARGPSSHCLERLYLTANCLTDDVSEVIIAFRGLKILHLAYNCLTVVPDTCINFWPEIEELVLSGNSFIRLPDNLPQLNNIKTVRAHSNRLRSVPMFACSPSVKVLDFAHNELESIDLRLLAPKQLKFLDISCNKKLQVDPSQFNAYRCQRPLSLVDVTGRQSLPWPQKNNYHEELNGSTPWSTGFSECPNKFLQLCCAQIRLPSFCNKEGLFAVIDGETDIEVPKILQASLPGLLLEEKSIKETVNEYMKYVVLSAHRELKEKGQRKGACLIMCHLSPLTSPDNNGFGQMPRRYSMRLANVGDTRAVLSRRNGPLILGVENKKRLGYSSRYPNTVPDPDVIQTIIKEDDEFLLLGNGNFWNAISIDTAISEVRAERNPVLAAKRLQDLVQSYGIEDCISVLIIRFDNGKSDVDMLMRELRQTITTNKSVCRPDCCCSRLEACCHSTTPPKPSSDRSSPSGQSDRPPSEAVSHQHYASVRSSQTRASERRSCRGGVARAIRVRVEEDKEDDHRIEEPTNPEENFKCWEYMLEQNTQMLFDKELDNLSKGIKSNVSSLRNLKGLSGSSPQLHLSGKQSKGVPFLSKHFGSARSFGTALKPDLRFGSGRLPNGGPNAAYFGSLQRLMPYHMEYDFAVIQEKAAQSQDSLDLEGRMQQYWGVATTEL
ncbi:PH domain leucine-rich repeat protein phosphatase isoform X1 [Choristoneura fumiferana]|uniref:PH domain leucine-rich repeat protein phosphatase isoform X1 n=1 Tax=Choristoneura fumiferana TaxID=7141 RepID=UPI003D157A65